MIIGAELELSQLPCLHPPQIGISKLVFLSNNYQNFPLYLICLKLNP